MRVGICGGTFDPFHCGHLEPVLAVRDVMEWDGIIYVPARQQPFKTDRETASPFHRFAMVVLATQDVPAIQVIPWELERGEISFTVDTLEHLRSLWPDATLDWIVGDDNLAQLEGWRSIDHVFELANFAVLTRLGSAVPERFTKRVTTPLQRGRAGSITLARNEAVPVSSTEIRRRVAAGETIHGLVDARVARYIHTNALYKGTNERLD